MEPLKLEEAIRILLEHCHPVTDIEMISLSEAAGRVLAQDVKAERDQPPFPRSPLDGYAVRSADIANASKESPAKLEVIDEVTAGHMSSCHVEAGMAVRIMTGAPIPVGADCVVKQEDTDYGADEVEIYRSVRAWGNYCFAGEDYKKGTMILREGVELGAVEIGVLSSLGLTEVPVYRRPKVAVLATGDEVVLPGVPLKPGQIYDSNLIMLSARMKQWDIDLVYSGQVTDEPEAAADIIRKYIHNADLIVTTGGVSVGKKDIMHDVFRMLPCQTLFWKVAIKPGMPTLCGLYEDKLLICLSGNPYGAIANLELLVRPVLAKISRYKGLALKHKEAVLENSYLKKSPARRYLRAHYKDGTVKIADGSNDSGILSSMCGCNCMIEIPAGTERLLAGDKVQVVLI